MEGIAKVYPDMIANQDITLDVRAGEIHALLGENGAGKSTLVNILYGMTTPDHGRILWDGQPVRIDSTQQAIKLGIGMVHQHFMLVPPFTALENIILQRSSFWLSLDKARPAIQQLCDDYGLDIDLDQPVEEMPLGMQQRVEIVKALYRDARLLILDEPTTVLTPPEVERLFAILRRLRAADRAVLLISHKLDEVMVTSQRISVLRDGRLIRTLDTADATPAELARLMVGREVTLERRIDRQPHATTESPVISVENLHVPPIRGRDKLSGISLSVFPGEILGVAGIDGNGQRALLDALSGLRKPTAGTIRVPDRLHVGRIPDDRQGRGLLLDMSVQENLLLGQYNRPPLSRGGWLRAGEIRRFARKLVDKYAIRTPGVTVRVRKLSGGNQQKVILAREMVHQPPALIVANPTRGLDIGASEYVYQQLIERRNAGAAILLISTDLEEVLALSDRIVVLYGGKIVGTLPAPEATRERVGLMMTGTPA